MKSIVLYHTNYGTTKKAAEVISNHFKIQELIDINEFNFEKIKDYDVIFLGSNIRSTKIGKPVGELINKIKKWELNPKVFLFFVAGSPKMFKSIGTKLKQKNKFIQDFELFPGSMTYQNLNPDDRKVIEMAYEMMNRKLEDYNDFKEEEVIEYCKRIKL